MRTKATLARDNPAGVTQDFFFLLFVILPVETFITSESREFDMTFENSSDISLMVKYKPYLSLHI